jgi:DNA sulfur modification protein DndD
LILRRLILENFGLFRGRNTIDLVPREHGGAALPIVLIGGKNGSGKTTILSAIRLALYGRRALGSAVAQSEYEAYLRDRVHVASDVGIRTAAVSIEFSYSHQGVVSNYLVRRAWTVPGARPKEILVVQRDGNLLDDVDREEWEDFLKGLIPIGVSDLFFFDGEKIQQIAESADPGEHLSAALRGLLGIETVERLRVDLALLVAKRERSVKTDSALEQILRELGTTEREISGLVEQCAQLRTDRDGATRKAEKCRSRYLAEGGDLVSRRAELLARKKYVSESYARLTTRYKDLANTLLPLLFGTTVTSAYIEASSRSIQPIRGLANLVEAWRKSNTPPRAADWAEEHWNDLFTFASVREAQPEAVTYHSESIKDLQAANARREEAKVLRAAMIEAVAELDRIDQDLYKSENTDIDDASAVLLEAERHVVEIDALIENVNTHITAHRSKMESLIVAKRKALEAAAENAARDRQAALAQSVMQALGEYEATLLSSRLETLSNEFASAYKQLARKNDILAGVQIDPATFKITLLNAEGVAVAREQLSAGEKQIYAIALLWALAKTTRRPLPLIIDTPLARLDSDHRMALIQRYYPFASHQVILLSTDTEIDQKLFDELQPHVSHSCRLDYDSGRTNINMGYFNTPALVTA